MQDNPKIPKTPIVDTLFNFLSDEEDLKIALEWLDKSKIISGNKTELYDLTKKNKYAILK